ncbi:uncharacterized protein LOC142346024 isoform X2 [Convolutriloba macropyga]|uniref:uncharacterized protein LOC142346024 isoform X2 n=1 Tax=Convolutriloba macropyga TaxID=536237 RepID=UPI003F51C308
MAATGGHLSSSFSVLGDEIRAQRLSVKTPDFTRECCEQKRSRRDSDLYINEGWDRPKTGRIKEPFRNYKYEFRSGSMTVFEMSKRKSCCRSADWSERKRAKEEQKVLKSLERRDCFYCNCSHCSAFYRQVLAKHKIPYMRENRSTPSALTVQRQYHSRRSWKDEYGVKKGDRVIIEGKHSGRVKFIGPLNDNLLVSELYVGVKLDEPDAKFGTGLYHGKYYFDAPKGFGVFVKYEQITKCKKFDPTIEGGPHKKVLKNQSSLAWLYGQSLDEAEIKEHTSSVRSKTSSPKPSNRVDAKTVMRERQQKALLREWTEEYGPKHSMIMLNKFNELSLAVKKEEERLLEEEEERLREERELLEAKDFEGSEGHDEPDFELETASSR